MKYSTCIKYRFMFVFLAVMLFITATTTYSTHFEGGDKIHISALHKINEDLIVGAETVTIDGFLDGDLMAGCNDLNINGEITGSVTSAAYNLHHTGKVNNSLRAFVYNSVIDGYVGGSLLLFSAMPKIGKGAIIEKGADIYGETIIFEGKIAGNAVMEGNNISISGNIDGDLKLKADKIDIFPPAVITGKIRYTENNNNNKQPVFNIHNGVTTLVEPEWVPKEQETDESTKNSGGFTSATITVSKLLAAFIFGIIIIKIFNRYAEETFIQLKDRFSIALASGFLTGLVVVVSLLLFITATVFALIGLIAIEKSAPVGAFILILSTLMIPITSFISLTGALMFYTGKIVFASLSGYLIIRLFNPAPKLLGKFQLLIGLVIITLLFAIPYAGFLIYILVSIIGAGAIVLGVRFCHQKTG